MMANLIGYLVFLSIMFCVVSILALQFRYERNQARGIAERQKKALDARPVKTIIYGRKTDDSGKPI